MQVPGDHLNHLKSLSFRVKYRGLAGLGPDLDAARATVHEMVVPGFGASRRHGQMPVGHIMNENREAASGTRTRRILAGAGPPHDLKTTGNTHVLAHWERCPGLPRIESSAVIPGPTARLGQMVTLGPRRLAEQPLP
jgi:hypothetical protein